MTNLATSIAEHPAGETCGIAALFERHPSPSLLFTRDGSIARANAAARDALYAQASDLAGTPLARVLPGLDAPGAGLGEPARLARTAVRRLDGSTFMARVQIVSTDPDSQAPLLASFEDLTDMDREVDSANREFEALTSAAGHDLRSPLRILKGFSEALEDECGDRLTEDGRNFLREIMRAADRMEGLVDGLLAYSRAGRAEMSRENVDLTTLVDLVFYELRHAQGDRVVECHAEPGMNIWADVRLTMTVLRNLIGNAWKFTARNPGANVRCEVQQRGGRNWICVTDDGAGFDMAQASRLFQPFTRLHRQDEFPGHGMGLATAQRIIRRHGGEIEAESAPGQGTTVRFWLPPRTEM